MSRAMLARKAEAAPVAPSRTAAKNQPTTLRIGEPDDAYEREADRVADAVMAGTGPQWSIGRMSINAPLQRQCACGGSATAGGECDECKEKKTLQRKTAGAVQPREAPAVVHDVLRTPGTPLDAGSREFFERRFQHDFSHVRIHTDDTATESATLVQARAYTVGRHIVFGPPGYAPTTAAGRRLLAHELTHVVQQSAARSAGQPLVSRPRAQRDVAPDGLTPINERRGSLLQRSNGDTTDVEIDPTPHNEQKRLEQAGVHLPEVSQETWRQLTSHVGRTLEATERQRIAQLTNAQPPASPLALPQGPHFVLHDTAAHVEAGGLKSLAAKARGPLGEEGTAAYIPEAGPAVSAYGLYEGRRAASTQFERANDLMSKSKREAGYREIWRNAGAAARSSALDRALDGLQLSPSERTSERTNAEHQLSASTGEVRTTASWAADEICRQSGAGGATAPTASPLTKACAAMAAVFQARRDRTASTVNVEIVQDEGSDCRATGHVKALKPYTTNQYELVRDVYLKAALAAGRYPDITTHWIIDNQTGHCDPRCFDVHRLYSLIAAAMGHNPASEYGITPVYGTAPPANVWWQNTACGGPPP
jgi:Domain of unknown function (DUF4157)